MMRAQNLLASIKRLFVNEKGNVVVETAIATPFILLAIFGAVDIVRYLNIQESVIRAANTTADAIARQNGVTSSQVFSFLGHAATTINPDSTGGAALITVASIHKTGNGAPEVKWRRDKTGGTPYSGACQQVGSEGQSANLPDGFTLDEDETVIVAEACYTFVPSFFVSRAVFGLDFVPLDIYGRSITAARFGSLNVVDPG